MWIEDPGRKDRIERRKINEDQYELSKEMLWGILLLVLGLMLMVLTHPADMSPLIFFLGFGGMAAGLILMVRGVDRYKRRK